jgi:hypothetical protein
MIIDINMPHLPRTCSPTRRYYSLEAKLAAMDDAGVGIAVLRVPVWQDWPPLDACRAVNDEAADMCKRCNGRLCATACRPPWGGKDNPSTSWSGA